MEELNEIRESYDAFYFDNKYGEESTHKEQFEKLRELLKDNELALRALNWISVNYDCYYKDEYNEGSNINPFYYLECEIKKLESGCVTHE